MTPPSAHPPISWARARTKSFQYAFQGLRRLYCESNARIHAVATGLVVGLAWALGLTVLEWVLLALAATLVWVAEA
ncbi:MAG TPA: diacylglycerol kinase family protein, partial [Polyangiaceae bacterium]|nr:diacylglycerol kinase family protein [Polyangiaceae bacterium]